MYLRVLTGCLLVSGIFGFLSPAFATVSSFSIDSGYSRRGETSSTSGGTTTTTYSIFGGYTGAYGGCASPSSGSTCDSCSSMGTLTSSSNYSCSFTNVHPTLLLTMSFKLDAIPTTPQILVRYNPSGTPVKLTSASITSGVPVANSTITVTVPWSDICAAGGVTACVNGTEASFSGTLEVGLSSDGTTYASGSQTSASIKFHFKDAATGGFSGSLCSSGSPTGFCNFKVLPGDEKVYMTGLERGGLTPSAATDIKWYALRVFLTQDTGTFAIPLGNGVQYADFSILDNSIVNSNLSNNKVTGLTNEVSYMFTIGSVDETMIVQDILPSTSLNSTDHVAKPGKVVGLLDEQKCFIATAAYGSPMEEHVQTLRRFRNQFLLTNIVGKKFVESYYKYSPPVANYIAQHEILRTAMRMILWPVVYAADLAMQMTEGIR